MSPDVDPAVDRLLVSPPPRATPAEAETLARDRFGVSGRATPLPSERDQNFRIVSPTGPGHVLKIANMQEDRAVLAMQSAALRHIALRDPALPVPRVLAARDGGLEVLATLPGGSRHVVRLLTFLPGAPLHATVGSVAQAAALGQCLARIGLALRGFAHPAAAHPLLWNLEQAPRLHGLLPCIADPRLRALATDALDRHEACVAPRLSRFRRQVVHNDLNPHNVVVDPADPTRIAGVLDFGDAVLAPLVVDVATAASYEVGDEPLARVTALVGAYHATSPLEPEEVDVLPDLIALRFVLSVTIAEWRATLHPENRAYILRNHARAAAALLAFERMAPGESRHALRRACSLE